MAIYIATISGVIPEQDSYYGNSTIFYIVGRKEFHVVQNPDFPLKKGDEVTISSVRKRTNKNSKKYYYVFDISLTEKNYRRLPKITQDNTKIMSFLGYTHTKNGIKIIVGFANRVITPNNPDFEEYLLSPLKHFGVTDLPEFNGDIFDFLGDLIKASEHLIGEKIRVKLKYRGNEIILDDREYILEIE